MCNTEHTEEPVNNIYTVWVGGIEINDRYLDFDEATKTARIYRLYGFDDVVIETNILNPNKTSEENNVN